MLVGGGGGGSAAKQGLQLKGGALRKKKSSLSIFPLGTTASFEAVKCGGNKIHQNLSNG